MSALLHIRAFIVALTSMHMFRLCVGTRDVINLLVHANKRSPSKVCNSSDCTAMNKNWLSKVDLKKNPCEDFYGFTCGKYTDTTTEIDNVVLKVKKQLYEILKSPITKSDHKGLKMAKQMFSTCVKHDSNIEDLKKMISELGGWSLLNPKWNEKDFSIAKFYSRSIKIGYFPKSLFTIDVDINPETRQNIISIKRKVDSTIGLIQRIPKFVSGLESALFGANRDYIFRTFAPVFASKMNITTTEVMNEIFKFEQACELIDALNRRPTLPTRMKIKEAIHLYEKIQLIEIVRAVFNPVKISEDDIIQFDCPKCLLSLNEFFRNTTTKYLASYLMGSFVFDNIMDADDQIMNDWLKYNHGMNKEYYCSEKISNLFRRTMDYEYIEHHFDESILPGIKDFIQKLRNAMVAVLEGSTMMSPKTKTRSIDKIKAMIFKFAYDDEIKTGAAIKYYDKLSLNSKSYLLSIFNIMKFTTDKMLTNLGKPAKLKYLETTSWDAAMYFVYYNTVFLSVNVLMGALYSKNDRPQYLNYGGLGFIMAHEMNHAFDLMGRTFTRTGMVNKKFWTPESIKKQWEKTECIAHQYSSFINQETNNKVDGVKTLSENYADIGGMEVAYRAFNDVLNDTALLLPDFLNNTFQQLFWMSFATPKCAKLSKEEVLEREEDDIHAVERIRVNGVVMNSKQFAKDWMCKEKTPMNPSKKCFVWG